jgi:hypothetical protein
MTAPSRRRSLGLPLQHGAGADGDGAELRDGRRSGSGGGEGLWREAGGVTAAVEELDPVGQESHGIEGEGAGEGFAGLGGAGLYEDALDWGAGWGGGKGSGGGGWGGGGWGEAADLGGDGAFDVETVGGLGGRCPVEIHVVADAVGGEVLDHLGQIEGGGMGWSGAGAAEGQDQDQGEQERGGACKRTALGTAAKR